MSKIALSGNASGTGTLTIASQNTNSNYTLTIPNETGTLTTTASTPTFTGAVTAPSFIPNGSSAPTNGVYLPAANAVGIATNSTNAVYIDSSQNVGIGTSSPAAKLGIQGTAGGTSVDAGIILNLDGGSISGVNNGIGISFTRTGSQMAYIQAARESASNESTYLRFATQTSGGLHPEIARFTSAGYFKASNGGNYISSTGSYHEFIQTGNSQDMYVRATNGSFTNQVLQLDATRSSSSAFNLLLGTSGNDADTEFRIDGAGSGYADGTWNGNGADYAEFFESANGQALTLGATVVLDGNKVREATSQDPASAIIGVVRPKEPSKASMVIGNTAWNKWANKYLSDDFDRYIMEDHDVVEWEETITDAEGNTSTKQHSYESHNIPAGVTVPADAVRKTHDDKGNKFQHYKLNPAWDKDAEYVNRENRPEWNIIGLLGQVKVLKGQPVGDRWIKMRDVSATVEEWMVR